MDTTQSRAGRKTPRADRPVILRKVGPGWTAFPNVLLQDRGLTYVARGILVYLLSKPEGWDVRAVAIAADPAAGLPGHESLATVRRALRVLGAAGYYRVVRQQRRGTSGRLEWFTETWVSREPYPEWVAEWGTRKGRPVVLRHAPDPAPAPAAGAVPEGFAAGWPRTADAPPQGGFCAHPDHTFEALNARGECRLCASEQLAAPPV